MASSDENNGGIGKTVPVTLETALAKLPASLRETGDAVFYYPRVLSAGERVLTQGGEEPIRVERASLAYHDDPDWPGLPGHLSHLFLVDAENDSVMQQDCDRGPLVLADQEGKPGFWKPVKPLPKDSKPEPKPLKQPVPEKDLYHTDHFIPAKDCELPKTREKGGASGDQKCKKYAIILKGSAKTPDFEGEDWPVDQDMVDNATRMTDALQRKGYEVTDTLTIKKDFNELKDGDAPSPFQNRSLEKIIKALAKKVKCCDQVIFYYTGHGKAIPNLQDGGDHIERTGFKICAEADYTSTELADLLGKLKTCHLNVIMDCCHAGGFLKALTRLPGLEAACASCQWDENSYGSGFDPGHVAGSGSEFSSGFINGVGKAPADATAPSLLDDGFQESAKTDITAKAGAAAGPNARAKRMTHPLSLRRKKKCNCDHGAPQFTDEDACVKQPQPD